MITIIRNSILFLAALISFHGSFAQDFKFLPDGDNQVYYSKNIKLLGTGSQYGFLVGAPAAAYEWAYMKSYPGTWNTRYKFKSVANFIRVGIDHASKTEQANYKYKIVLTIKGFSNPAAPTSGVTSSPYEFVLEYNKDALETYKDLNVLKLPSSFYSFDVNLVDVLDISNGPPVSVPKAALAENFKIEAQVITQRYDLDGGNMKDVFVNSQFNVDNQALDIYWGHMPMVDHKNNPGFMPVVDLFKPVRYELEWLYVDDYILNSNGTKGYKFTSTTFNIPYDFRQNSTRVQTHNNHYSIPMVYGHGAVIFRLRKIRPDQTNFSDALDYGWNLPDNGTLTQTSFYVNGNNINNTSPMVAPSQCVYINTTPFINDSLNWQYNISFAEEGKSKHVINYFDGMGKNRQTQTKINSDNNYVVGIDNIYDFEGRPGITTLPTPVLSPNIKFKSGLSLYSPTGQPLKAADFDLGCGTDSIAPLSTSALSNIYYSALNPDKTGMQKYVPDAEGYPFIETRYAADYTDKVQWQGGAGREFQRWKGRGTNYVYSRAGQREMNRLFGSEGGYAQYYPKQTVIDPNGQASFSITDASGKVVATGLSGASPDAGDYPLDALNSLPAATYRESDVLLNFPQDIGRSFRNAQVNYFNEALSQNSLRYKLKIPPFPACNNQFIRVKGDYKVRLFDECNVQTIIELDDAVNSNSISNTTGDFHVVSARDSVQIVPGKYTVQKELTFSDSAITALASEFVDNNNGQGLCYSGSEPFVRTEIEQSTFPCEPGEEGNSCDALKKQMMQELYPGAKYGQYIANTDGSFSAGVDNSIFTLIVAPLDQNWAPTDTPVAGDRCKYTIRENYWSWQNGTTQNEHLTLNDPQCINTGYLDVSVEATYPYILPPNPTGQTCPPVHRSIIGMQCSTLVSTSIPATRCLYEVDYYGEEMVPVSCMPGGFIEVPGGDTRYFWVTDVTEIPPSIEVPAGLLGQLCDPPVNVYIPYVTAVRDPNAVLEPLECIYYVPPHHRYQSACLGTGITVPVKRISAAGSIYYTNTLLKDVTPDLLIASFNDEIAEKLLPLHPEYCKLLACDGSDFETILAGIETYDQAAALGMSTLASILSKDPLSQTNPNAPNAPFTGYELSHFALDAQLTGAHAGLLKRLDTMALIQAYCGSNAADASLHCEYYTYASQIASMNMADPAIKERYIRALKALYLANRSTRKQIYTDGISNNCGPCEDMRMELTGSPVFPKVYNNAGEFDPDAVPAAMKNDINNYLNNPTATVPAFVQDRIDQHQNSICTDQINAILNDLKPCIFHDVIMGDLAMDLAAYCNANGIENLTPGALRTILQNRIGFLDDICQAFAVKYQLFEPDPEVLGDYISLPPDLYSGLTSFLNRSNVKSIALNAQASGSSVVSIALDATNKFENRLATALGVANTATVSARAFTENLSVVSGNKRVVKVRVYSGSNSEHIYLAERFGNNAYLPHGTASVNFNNAYPVLKEMPVLEGGIADKLAFIPVHFTIPIAIPPYAINQTIDYAVWTNSIPFLKLKSKDGIEDCINCEQLRRALTNYWTDTAFHKSPNNAKHPLFFETLKNHLNYTLGATQDLSAYLDLMEGCAISDRSLFRNAPATVEYRFSSSGTDGFNSARTRMTAIRNKFKDISIHSYAFRRPNGHVHLRLDLSSVPKDSLGVVKQYLMGLSGSPAYVVNGFDAELFRVGTGAPTTFAGATVSTEAVTYLLPDATATSLNWHRITCSNYTIPNVNAVMDAVKAFVTNDANGAYYQVHYGYRQFRSDDHNTTQKTAYLNYVYGLSALDDNALAEALAPAAVRSNISSLNFLRAKLSYNDPWKENEKRHLYYWDSAQTSNNPGYSRLITTLNQVGTSLTGAKLFPASPQVNISGATGNNNASVKAFRLANGNAWIRIFDAQNRKYNIYLVPSAQMAYPAEEYQFVPTAPAAYIMEGADGIYRFKISMRRGAHYVMVEGYTDFPLGTGAKLENVVIAKNGNAKGRLIDTMTCESGIMAFAEEQGMQRYYAYIDSIKLRLRNDMQLHFAQNSVDTLILGTREQQYHYTLYYYDQAGNLTRTVPPQGVNPMPDASQATIDNARNAAGTNTVYTQKAAHNKISAYRYNTLDLPVWQQTPDGGITEFFYDLAGRLSFSQNAKQQQAGTFSYTLYDAQGRIEETGVVDAIRAQVEGYTLMDITNGASPYTNWIKSKTRKEVVATRYDEPLLALGGFDMLSPQQNLRKRVSAVLYSPAVTTQQGINEYYHYATHFSYDAMGNVDMLVHDNPYLNYLQQRFKRIDYDYDLLSGKVNMLSYNRGFADQFYQRYDYDADNRITKAETSKDGLYWERDAAYEYYKHGPLAQMQLGDLNVQGVQYAYTIQGWLKAINGDVLNAEEDMGKDGVSGHFPKDVVAHALDYYKGDYKAIDATRTVSHTPELNKSLYNGNITRQTTAISGMDNLVRDYRYDQLHRIKETQYSAINNMSYAVTGLANAFKNTYGYDADGNLLNLQRYNGQQQKIDEFTYHYTNPAQNNRLGHVADASGFTGGNDLQSQSPGNYTYDAIGNLTRDLKENIKNISWNSYGKMDRLVKGTATDDTMTMVFQYDGMGNRIRKDVWREEPSSGGAFQGRYSDIYVRDAQGNILAVYKEEAHVDGNNTIDWLNSQMGGVVSQAQLASFFSSSFGANGSFATALLDYSFAHAPDWAEGQLSDRSTDYYLANSADIYGHVLARNLPQAWEYLKETGPDHLKALFIGSDRNINNTANLVTNAVGNHMTTVGTLNKLVYEDNDLTAGIFANLPEGYNIEDPTEVSNMGGEERVAFLGSVLAEAGALSIGKAYEIAAHNASSEDFVDSWINDEEIFNFNTFDKEANMRAAMRNSIVTSDEDEAVVTIRQTFADWMDSEAPDHLNEYYTGTDLLNAVFNADKVVFLEGFIGNVGIDGISSSITVIPGINALSYSNLVATAVSVGQLSATVMQYVNTPSPQNINYDNIWLAEHHLYGSSRLGVKQYGAEQYRNSYSNVQPFEKGINVRQPWYSLGTDEEIKAGIKSSPLLPANYLTDTFRYVRNIGSKFYEMTDHLGNVLATVLDRKTGYGASAGQYAGFNADVASATDYFPFGMEMPGRTIDNSVYRFGFNTQEKVDEIAGKGNHNTALFWEYDTRLGRRWNLDPRPNWSISSYATFSNNPNLFGDQMGDTTYRFNKSNGKYIGMFDTDASGQFGSYGEYQAIGKGKNSLQQWDGQYFHFADPENDSKDIRDGFIKKIVFVSDADIKGMLDEEGAFNYKDKGNPYKFYKNSTGGEKFDYSFSGIHKKYGADGAPLNPLKTKSPLLYLPEGDYLAHNHMNFGNYLWAASGYTLGFSMATLQAGGHINSIMNPGTNGYDRQWDSKDDQESIKSGAFHAEKYRYRAILETRRLIIQERNKHKK